MDLFNYRYHVYRRRPGVGGTLNCTPEPGNRHDIHAVVVKDLDGVTIQWRIQRGAEGTFAPPPPKKRERGGGLPSLY